MTTRQRSKRTRTVLVAAQRMKRLGLQRERRSTGDGNVTVTDGCLEAKVRM
jgi:hypothetical protein